MGNNPVNYQDPTGHLMEGVNGEADLRNTLEEIKQNRIQLPNPNPRTDPDLSALLGTDFRFTASPVDTSKINWTNGFGAYQYAKEKCDFPCSTGSPGECKYRKTRGLHPGLDLGVQNGTPVIWTGNVEGKVIYVGTTYGDAVPNVVISVENYLIIFGGLTSYLDETYVNKIIPPGTEIGTTGSEHLHLAIRAGDYYNPLYFFPPEIAQGFISNMSEYVEGEGPWSMISYTNGSGECSCYYWGESPDQTKITRP